ncbi:MAG: glycosyltransferase family A protein [Pseudomonadota bacterium]
MADPVWFTTLKHKLRSRRLMRDVVTRTPPSRPHGLPSPLTISLTSYPERFARLSLTLNGLLRQTVTPDAVILWVADGDIDQLPRDVRALESLGLKIKTCEDLRSYKKLIPALAHAPDHAIITTDDDVHYPADWLEGIVETARAHPGEIISRRTHRVRLDDAGKLLPYDDWEFRVGLPVAGMDLFSVGVGGVFYPPGCFDPRVTDVDAFMKHCPTSDDVWFNWMARLKGVPARNVGATFKIHTWPDTQASALEYVNRAEQGGSGNDQATAAMVASYGLPFVQ